MLYSCHKPMVLTTQQKKKLVNLNYQINKFIVKIMKSKYLGLKMLEMVYNPTTTIALKFNNLLHNLVIPYMKLVIEFMGVSGLKHL